MNTPNNKRRRQSRETIEKVFLEMLQTRDLDQVRVSELCKRAGVNRTTFYANYTDVYALADSIRDRLESELADLYREEIAAGVNSNDYLKLFCHIRDNQIFYRTYFKLGYDNNYKIILYDTDLAQAHFQNRFIPYHMAFFKSGLTRIIRMWLDSGCQETPEEMFEILKTEYRGQDSFFAEPHP